MGFLGRSKVNDSKLKKVNFGCGSNKLPGWENYDSDVDISKPLPFEDASCDYILAEHVVEHISFHQAYHFLDECHRILKPGGVARILVPGIDRIWKYWNPTYGEIVRKGGFADGTKGDCLRAIMFEHGHLAGWTEELLGIVLQNVGFRVSYALSRQSNFPELVDIDGHHKVIGEMANSLETIIIDAQKIDN